MLASAWVTVRVFRQGVFALPDRLVVRNIMRTFDIPWSDIHEIDPPKQYGLGRDLGIQIRLKDGSTRAANLFAAGPYNRPEFADEVVSRLRELHARCVAQSPSS